MFSPKRILVPTDFSEYSDSAIGTAIDIAKQNGARLYLLHVISIVQTCAVDYCFDQTTLDELERKSSAQAMEMMEKQIGLYPEAGSVEIIRDVKKGVPYQEILSEQQARDIDLIVMSSHGKTGLIEYLLGSVADKVVKKATCPVMLIRKPRPE